MSQIVADMKDLGMKTPKPTVALNVVRREHQKAAEESGRKITNGDGQDKRSDTKNDKKGATDKVKNTWFVPA